VNSRHRHGLAVLFVIPVILTAALWAQDVAAPEHQGYPQDWSDHSVVFSLDGLLRNPDLMNQEPRIAHQFQQRFQPRAANFWIGMEYGSQPDAGSAGWTVNFVRGHVAVSSYPAKYTFDPSAPPSCTSDYVVFALDTASAVGGQANVVGLNNLYAGSNPTGICSGSAPNVMFAYSTTTVTGGHPVGSPVISLDGTKIAFVESVGTASVFHVVKWASGKGQIEKAVAPSSMTSLTYSANATTTSSPWVDYRADVAYISDDKGVMYKISPVFGPGTPALVKTSPWPIQVAATRLTPPVLDKQQGYLIAGGRNGDLYEINISTGAAAALIVGTHSGVNSSILAPPIVDLTNGTIFVVSSNANGGASAVLEQVHENNFQPMATANIGLGSTGGTAVDIYQPALSNGYYTNPADGFIYTCGTGPTDTTPWQYSFGFTGIFMSTVPASKAQLLTSTAAICTPWTEFFNPNIGANGTDLFFFGLTQDCTTTGTAGGCVAEITSASSTPTFANVANGPSGIIVDNYSTAAQAANVYFSGEGSNRNGYRFSQNGLQ